MAQVLKSEIKEQIIEAAKKEFMTYGYKDASMRRIASASNTSLGNLYRYFKNKEDVNLEIVSPTLKLVDSLLQKVSENMLSFNSDQFSFSMSTEQLKEALLSLSDGLIDIYQKHHIEFRILLLNSQLNHRIEDWFIKLTQYIIFQNNPEDKALLSLAKVYAVSAFDGLKQLFQDNSLDRKTLKKILNIYMLNYIDTINRRIEVAYE